MFVFSWVHLGGTSVSKPELLIGKQYCLAKVNKKLRETAEILTFITKNCKILQLFVMISKCNKSRRATDFYCCFFKSMS